MLYPFHLIREEPLNYAPPLPKRVPQVCFLEAASIINDLFHCAPKLLTLEEGRKITLLYRNVAYLAQDIGDCVGACAAAAQIRLFGTSEGRETVEIRFHTDGSNVIMALSSVSGQDFDHLQGLGIQMECQSQEDAQRLSRLVSALPNDPPFCICVDGEDQAAVDAWGLLLPTPGSLYGYLAEELIPEKDLLLTLSFQQKAALWRNFIADHQQPAEFIWLWSVYYDTKEPLFLLEWELALRLVLEELHFQVEHRDNFFRLLDGAGTERRFDFARGGPAEKVFLKLLFPLDTK